MVKIIIKAVTILTLLLVSFFAKAQDFQGKAEYFSKFIKNKKVEVQDNTKEEPIDPELKKAIDEAIKKASEKSYSLTFSKFESVYEQNKELAKPETSNSAFSFSFDIMDAGVKYINLKENKFINEEDIFGKEFLIVDELKKPNWILINETKKIGEYNCFKAELIIPVTERQQKEYDEFLKKEETKPSLFKIPKPEDKVVIAWYTPEIPVSLGPDNYWGLPGLILEINEKNKIILCSKITLSNKAKTEIKKPSTGKVVTQAEFDEIQKKKLDSMKDEDGNIIFQTED